MLVSDDDVEMLDIRTGDSESRIEIVEESLDCYSGYFVAMTYRGLDDFDDDEDDDPYCELGEGD